MMKQSRPTQNSSCEKCIFYAPYSETVEYCTERGETLYNLKACDKFKPKEEHGE